MKKAVLNFGTYVPDSTVSKPSRIIFIVRGFVFSPYWLWTNWQTATPCR